MVRSRVRWLAGLIGGLVAGLCVGLLQLKVQQENLQPTLLLKFASVALIGLGFGLPWLLFTGRHIRHPALLTQGQCQRLLAMVAIGSALASPVCAHGGTETPSAGRQLATVHCSRCHGIDDERFILVPGALPLRDLKQRYPEELLAEALVANLRTAHLELSVTFSPAEMAALLSYLNSLW